MTEQRFAPSCNLQKRMGMTLRLTHNRSFCLRVALISRLFTGSLFANLLVITKPWAFGYLGG